MPTVSVIVPTYNRADLLREAIVSVQSQTFADWEIVVADDGSTDNTREVVLAYQSEKIKYLALAHRGRSHARNRALEVAEGRYVAFLDSDDVYLPGKLELQVACLDHEPNVALVYTTSQILSDAGVTSGSPHNLATANGYLYGQVASMGIVVFGSILVRASVVREVGAFDEKLDRFEDIDFCRRVVMKYPAQGLYQPLVRYRWHTGNEVRAQAPQEILRNLDYYVSKLMADGVLPPRVLREMIASMYFNYGITLRQEKVFVRAARPFFVRSIRYNLAYPSAYFHIVDTTFAGTLTPPLRKMRRFFTGK